ncbi:MAG: tRNA (5-methylaminomethyl-2-thiouridine)(34)-methyltransferase MnmD [Lentimicrobiaceae bacterium]
MSKIILAHTEDGSYTLFNEDINEHYHSIHGAVRESTHIFINAGLMSMVGRNPEIRILEIGFGTGLNALLTLIEQQKLNIKVNYSALEPYPVPREIYEKLNYCNFLAVPILNSSFELMHSNIDNNSVKINRDFTFNGYLTTFQKFESVDNNFDLIYLDAFSPDTEPALWTEDIFIKLHRIMNKEGVIVTYCSKGIVRRLMQSCGFSTERLPGPPGKHEILRATAL